MSSANFHFISTSEPSVPKSNAERTLIRKQAMKHVSEARRRAGNYGQHNLRQIPIFVSNSQEKIAQPATHVIPVASVISKEEIVCGHCGCHHPTASNPLCLAVDWAACTSIIPGKPSSKGYELLRARYGVDIDDLSMLTTFHVGRATVGSLSKDLFQLRNLLHQKHSSYFAWLPIRYDHVLFLDDAVECVLARVQQITSPNSNTKDCTVLSLYAKALKSLQTAINNPSSHLESELLCAICILALFELLDCSREQAWKHHAAGAARCIKLRGTFLYNSEFEKALFIAQTGPIITEAIFNNEHCFLDHASWHAVFRSVILEGYFHDRSSIAIALRIHMCALPGLFADVTDAVCHGGYLNGNSLGLLNTRVNQQRLHLLHWRCDFDALTEQAYMNEPPQDLSDQRTEILGTYLAIMILVNRLMTFLCIDKAAELEDETVVLTTQLMDMDGASSLISPHTYLFTMQKLKIARAILASTQEWQAAIRHSNDYGQERIISAARFESWCELLRRNTTKRIYEAPKCHVGG